MPTQPAILGTARLGNVRLGYVPAALVPQRVSRVRILLAGVEARVRVQGLTIRDVLNDAPNTCSLTIDGSESPVGAQSLRVSINSDTPRLLFNGALQAVGLSYQLQPDQLVWPASAIDDTPRANRRRPFGTWTTVSATTVVQDLVAVFAPGFTSTHVEAALPAVSVILDGSEGMNGALTQIANLIGGYFYWEDGDLHFFLTEATDTPDDLDSTPGRFLDDPPIQVTSDDSQLRTRVFGKGHGEALLTDVLANEPILPVANVAAWFGTVGAGGQAIALSQILAYTGVQLGVGGSLVGPGAAPPVAPSGTAVPGSGMSMGVYRYAYTDVTAAGESLPSPLGTVTTGAAFAAPSTAPTVAAWIGSGFRDYAVTFVTADGETTEGPRLQDRTFGGIAVQVQSVPLGPAGVIARKVYRTTGNAVNGPPPPSQLKLVGTINDNTTTVLNDGVADGSLGANVPTTNTSGGTVVNVAGIAIGASPTTSRKLYRTVVGGAQLKLVTTLANNTATTYTDSTADGSLGANAPTSDTSGISFAGGQVNAGSTAILTASAAPFQSGGGWALAGGDQVVRYTGIAGNSLTGVPATGPGTLGTTVLYGSQILPAPALIGVTGNALAILKGTLINVWVQRDDVAAQAELAARDGRDGIIEAPPISDERRNEASLIALGDASLARYSRPLVTVTYACRDPKTKSGKPITIDLASPPIHETLTIQECTIDQIDVAPGLLPRFTVTASSVRQSLDALLRQLLAAAA